MSVFKQLGRRWPARIGAAALAIVAIAAGAAALADSRSHERALEAFRTGEIVSLRDVLREVERRYLGQVIEVELERDDDGPVSKWIYELRLISPDGNVANIEMDAKSMAILKIEGRVTENPAAAK